MYLSFSNLWVSSLLKGKELLTSYKKYECDSLGVGLKLFLFVFYGLKVNFVLVGCNRLHKKRINRNIGHAKMNLTALSLSTISRKHSNYFT